MSAQAHTEDLVTDNLPLEERIRQRAHDLYVERGGASESELEDWLQAEEEIREMDRSDF